MPSEVIPLRTVTRVFAEDCLLVESPELPEASVLGDSEAAALAGLAARSRYCLADPELSPLARLHRRRVGAAPTPDTLEMRFEPPRHCPEWQEPVVLRIPFVRWEEGGFHHAFVPALGLRVMTPRPDRLVDRVREHIRLVLGARGRHVTLRQLADWDRVQSLRLGRLEVAFQRSTPRELAVGRQAPAEGTSALARLAEELTPKPGEGAGGEFAYGLEDELRCLAEALGGPRRQSVLLVGPPGSGKTALFRELARRRAEFGFGRTPFWVTTAARLMSGTAGLGMWQERCRDVCREAARLRAVLHVGNLADLLEVGKVARGGLSVGTFLRPWIAAGEPLIVAECTAEQLGAVERGNPHLPAVFLHRILPERTPAQTRVILERVATATFAGGDRTAAAGAAATPEALDRLHALHLRYATYSARPGRPLRFLRNLLADRPPGCPLAEAEVVTAFSRETGLPGVLLDDRVPLDPGVTREVFARRVIGQPEAVDRVVDLLAVVKARLARPRKPLASFLFIGPTGTGKTEMAKALAEFLFGDPARMVRFDLNEFADPASVGRLIGGPLAAGDEGLLTARVREQPFGVVLLDEFEKAHPSLFDLLLQVLGEGRLTDAAGRVADFCNTVIVMTTNLGARTFQRGPTGFRADGRLEPDAAEHFADAVRQFLRPELFNRLDVIVPFRPLTADLVLAIARRQLELVLRRDGVRLRPVECRIQPGVAEHLARRGYDARYGARPLKRAIEQELIGPLAEALNGYPTSLPLRVEIRVRHGRVQVLARARSPQDGKPAGGERLDGLALAGAVVSLRRTVSRLARCTATGRIEDEVALLGHLERRVAAAPWVSPETRARLAPLRRMRDCLADLRALAERVAAIETETLCRFHLRDAAPPEVPAPSLAVLEAERRRLLAEVFRFQHRQPDEIVLAVFGEPREALLELLDVYLRLPAEFGRVQALDAFEPADPRRSSDAKLVRSRVRNPAEFLVAPPEKALGVVCEIRGDLVYPRLAPEEGLHVVKGRSGERHLLVEVANVPFDRYRPPEGLGRPGALKARGAPVRRLFLEETGVVKDRHRGERRWSPDRFRDCVLALLGEQFDAVLEATAG